MLCFFADCVSHNTVTAEKNRWIKLLGISTIILVLFIVTVLLIDGLNPTISWIRRDLAAYYSESFIDSVQVFVRLFGL